MLQLIEILSQRIEVERECDAMRTMERPGFTKENTVNTVATYAAVQSRKMRIENDPMPLEVWQSVTLVKMILVKSWGKKCYCNISGSIVERNLAMKGRREILDGSYRWMNGEQSNF